jgi:hypothetical protein
MQNFFSAVPSRRIEVADVRVSIEVGCVRKLNNQSSAFFSEGRVSWDRSGLNDQMPYLATCNSASRNPFSKKSAP